MKNDKRFHPLTVYDSIWGDIQLTNCEAAIINTRAFQRLKHIKQMSLAYIGHAGAQHTRFEHSLGCLYVADYLVRNIVMYDKETEDVLGKYDIKSISAHRLSEESGEIIRHVRIAALLHDIGHAPMSHLFEEVYRRNPKLFEYVLPPTPPFEMKYNFNPFKGYGHEKYSVYQILNNKQLNEIFTQFSVNRTWLSYLIDGYLLGNEEIPEYIKMCKALISGDFDADRIDYINRDFNRCGINSVIDLPRYAKSLNFCSFLKISKETGKKEDGSKIGHFELRTIVNSNYIVEISNLLFQRFMLTRRVHQNELSSLHEQVLISIISKFLKDKKEKKADENIKWIHKAHTEYRDTDMVQALKKYIGSTEKQKEIENPNSSINDIIDGALDNYRSYPIMVNTFSPSIRYPAYYICVNKELINTFNEKMRETLISNDVIDGKTELLSDFVFNRPSKMEITAVGVMGKTDERIILDSNTSSLPHAMYESCINSLQVAIYTDQELIYKKDNPDKIENLQKHSNKVKNRFHAILKKLPQKHVGITYSQKEKNDLDKTIDSLVVNFKNKEKEKEKRIENYEIEHSKEQEYHLRKDISKAIEITFFEKLTAIENNNNCPIEMMILLIYMHLLYFIRDKLDTSVDVKIKGDVQFHNFVQYVFEEFIKINPSIKIIPSISMMRGKISADLLKTTESLTYWGYIDRIYKVIRFQKINDEFTYTSRADRMINRWGLEFIKNCIKEIDKLKKISNKIKKIVYKKQEEFLSEHKILMIHGICKENESDDLRQFRSKIEHHIREGHGCIYKYTYRTLIQS